MSKELIKDLKNHGLLVISPNTAKSNKYKYLNKRPKHFFITTDFKEKNIYLNSTDLDTMINRDRYTKTRLALAINEGQIIRADNMLCPIYLKEIREGQ